MRQKDEGEARVELFWDSLVWDEAEIINQSREQPWEQAHYSLLHFRLYRLNMFIPCAIPQTLHRSVLFLNFTTILRGRYYYSSHFIVEKKEAQRIAIICPRPRSIASPS